MAEDSDEMESFDINDEDLKRAYNPTYMKKKKMSKSSAMLGIWAESDDDNDDDNFNQKKQSKSSTINFVSSSSSNKKEEKQEEQADSINSEESSDEEQISTKTSDKIILDNLDEIEKDVREKKSFIRKHTVFTNNKSKEQQQSKKSFQNVVINKKAQQEIGNWEKHTKGIGMKLMEKMGWEKGKGIGKDLQGRAIPVEATVRKGKASVGMYGPESKEVRQKQQEQYDNEEENDDESYRPSHVSQWKKNKNKKVNYNAITPDQLLEMAANNPKKLKKIEQMLDLSETKSKHSDTVSGLKTSKIKIIDMTGKEQRVMHGYESISQINKQSNFANEKKEAKKFDLPELSHNLELLVNLTENKILNFDKKLKHTEDTIVNLQYEEKKSKERVKVESEQIEKLKLLLSLIEECELSVKKENVTIEELIDSFQSLQTNYADEFIIFNLMELAIPLLVPVIKRRMINWSPFDDEQPKSEYNQIMFCYDIFSELKTFLSGSNYNYNKSNNQVINPYHRIVWETWMPSFRRIISRVNIRKYAVQTVELINNWSCLLPKWILENIFEQIVLPKLISEVEAWNPLTDTVPIHKWIHPWLPLIKERLDLTLFPTIRFKLTSALTSWHPSDVSAKAILLPWRPPAFSSSSWETIMCRSILPKLDLVLNEELEIKPNEQNIEPFHWVISWFDLIQIDTFVSLLERSFFPKWLQILATWLNTSPDYNEISKWYMGWKSLFNEKLVQHPIVKSKLSQGLMMMNRSVSGSTVSYQQTQHPVTSNAVASKPAQEEKLAQSASLPSISSFKELIERKAVENNILFVQIPNRFKEGKQIYRFGNLNVYIDRNVLFMLLNGTWIPASINDILQKTL